MNRKERRTPYYGILSTIRVYLIRIPPVFLPDIPKISTGSTDELTASETESLTIPCTISAVPSVTSLVWLLNEKVIDTSNSLEYSGGTIATPSLTILNLQASHAGVYKCRATNDVGTSDSRNVTVYVNCKFHDDVASRCDIIKQGVCCSTPRTYSRLLCGFGAFEFHLTDSTLSTN